MLAEELIRYGNTCYLNKEYILALEYYKKALSIEENNDSLWSNLAAVYLKSNKYYLAYESGMKSTTEKGYFRVGLAAYAMRQYEKSKKLCA